jgi:hypothetical protein
MQMRDIILLAITVAALIIIVRTIMYIPLMQRAIEQFADASAIDPVNSLTECPAGAQIYMYEGVVYCCNGLLNPDADTVQRSCKPAAVTGERLLCTLGPSRNGVVNCLDTIAGKMQEQGESVCPPSLPNFCKPTGSIGRCCSSSPNKAFTDCTGGPSCDISSNTIIFTDPTDCRFLRAQQLDTPCPLNYSQSLIPGKQDFVGMTLIGCSNGTSSICYTQNMLDQLKALGGDISELTPCASS